MGNRPRHGVVVLTGDDQQRSTLGILRVDLCFRPRVGIGGGLPRPADDDFSAESGRGSTPRNGAGSIATVTTATPSPANICAMRPPKEWPMTAGFVLSWRMASM